MLSVITCTHNPRTQYFVEVLRALQVQTLDVRSWEYIIVDNLSADLIAGRFDVAWHPNARIIREDVLGLTPARLRGIRESRGDLLVFVDDDNVLNADYLEEALRVMGERPFLGAWSGQCRARFEETPPEWTARYWGNLVIRNIEQDLWSNLPRLAETMPCGAGLCVRRDAARRYLELHENGRRNVQLDRTGSSLLSGGDNDLAACACDIGLGVGVLRSLKLEHLIPPQRLTPEYLERLAEGIHFSSTLLDAAWGLETAPRRPIGLFADWLRVMRIKPPHRNILRAAYRGRNRALSLIANEKKS